MKRWLTRITNILVALATLFLPLTNNGISNQAKAAGPGKITVTNVALSDFNTNAKNVALTIDFTPQTTVGTGGRVVLGLTKLGSTEAWPAPSSISDVGSSANLTNVFLTSPGSGGGFMYAAIGGTSLQAGTSYRLAFTGINNPTTAGLYFLAIWTKNPGNTAVVDGAAIDPVAQLATPNLVYIPFMVGTPSNAIWGKITNPAKNAVPAATVQLHTATYSKNLTTISDNNGFYYFSGMSNGSATDPWVLDVRPPQFGQGLTAPEPLILTSYVSGVQMTDRSFGAAPKTITGKIALPDGTGVQGATVIANKAMGGGGAMGMATTDSTGTYTMNLAGGDWQVMPCPSCNGQGLASVTNWAYASSPVTVSFPSDSKVESKTVNFGVVNASSTVTGKITLPDGSAPPQSKGGASIGISIYARGGFGIGGGLNPDGTFSVKVPAGTYNVNVYDPAGAYSSGSIPAITLKNNQSLDLGTIKLTLKTDIIRGTVLTSDGKPVPNMSIGAVSMREEGQPVSSSTGSDGTYQLKVTPGSWMVMGGDFSGQTKSAVSYVIVGGGKMANVVAGTASVVDFTAVSASANIAGTVVDGSKAILQNVYARITAVPSGSASSDLRKAGGIGGNVEGGLFNFNLPPGTYSLEVMLPPGSNYTPTAAQTVTVTDGQKATATITMVANDSTISGTLVDENGAKISDVNAEVYAVNSNKSLHPAKVNSDGSYSISVAGSLGPWYVGAYVSPASGYFQEPASQDGVSLKAGETVTRNIVLHKANSVITGKVTDSDGKALAGVSVSADTRTLAKSKTEVRGPMFNDDVRTGDDGSYTINVPAGTYYVNAHLPVEKGFVAPKSEKITIAGGATMTVNLQFRASNSTISGTVRDSSGNAKSALVWAYSEEGAYTEASAGSDGKYILKVTQNEHWHVGANTEGGANNTDKYYSADTLVDTGSNTTNTLDITLTKVADALPAATTTSTNTTSSVSLKLTDNTQVDLPANSLGTEGVAVVNVTPSAEVGHQLLNKPLSDAAYDITATNLSTGTPITTLNSSATITLPYDQSSLDSKGLNETTTDIIPAYWNDTDGTWTPVAGATIDTGANTITFRTDHFTKYALVAANDTTVATVTTATVLPATGQTSPWMIILGTITTLAVLIGGKIYLTKN